MAKERLDKLLAHEGFGSRKDIRKLLRSCEVLVNGKQIYDPGFAVDAEKDNISVDGEEVNLHKNLYLMMNKPQHYVCSTKEGDHETVFDLLDDSLRTPYLQEKLHLVGRLDMDTEGLLLFTTDGELTHRLISPKSHISKTYLCGLEHAETAEHQAEITKQFEAGIEVGPEDNEQGFTAQPAQITWLNDTTAQLTIYEGKYHQVKRMFAAVGNKIVYLKRISMGQLKLDKELELGKYKELTDKDLELIV
ncbi:pseudouridine synthase [Treponema bryantii]|uniref:pseudouridine synthase n=1 Tax=Treponema bryantii TaxID=163 RepID=UPI0003B532F2|nr:pseudouridine synthase [Treponema bryantii]